jgi:proteasome assembly chaperone (PAC2) family protein
VASGSLGELLTDHVRWSRRPALRSPVLIAAFEGWNDAGDGASGAVRTLLEAWHADPFADIDPEEFYDFTATRPLVRLIDGKTRSIEWPTNTFSATTIEGSEVDVVLLLGHEPGLKWRTFCEQIVEVVRGVDARMVVTLGALLAEVPHTRPVRVIGTAEDDGLIQRLRLRRSTYEGPTGIVGTLHEALRRRGVPSASLWAAVPTYVSGPASPAAALALVRRVVDLLGVPFDISELEEESVEYARRLDEVVADDDDLREFLARLESAYDDDSLEEANAEVPDPGRLIEEVERYLRDQ